jgi:hypothetical protein
LPFASIVGSPVITAVSNRDGQRVTLAPSQTDLLQKAFKITPEPGNTNDGVIDWTFDYQGAAGDLNFIAGRTITVTNTIQVQDQDSNTDTATVTNTLALPPTGIDYRFKQPQSPLLPSDIRKSFSFVGEYLGGNPSLGYLTYQEVKDYIDAGLSIFTIYETAGGTTPAYFTYTQGQQDGSAALKDAENVGQTPGAPIYFAVDFDPGSSLSGIISYFEGINQAFDAAGAAEFSVGVYGGGAVLTTIKDTIDHDTGIHLATYGWLAESPGYTGSRAYTNWNLEQIYDPSLLASATRSSFFPSTTDFSSLSYIARDLTNSSLPSGAWNVQSAITVTNPPPPPGTTAHAVMRDGTTGRYEIYNIGNNTILAGYSLGQVGINWQSVGLGAFNNTVQAGNAALGGFADTVDMVLRDSNSGAFEVYNISANNIINAASLGAVGLNWQFGGFGDFSSRAGETDMILRNSANGALEVYDIANNALVSAYSMGAVGLDWQVAGVGDFSSRPNETDMIMRNANTGALEVYDIANNALMSAYSMGAVGLDWQVAGFGNFSSRANETDMIMRNSNTGALEVYNIANNALMSAYPMGAVGLDWQVVGFGNFSGNADETDMIMRNSSTGALEVYDIANNALTAAYSAGAVGLNWEVGGIAPAAQSASAASMGDSSQVGRLVQAMTGFGGDAAVASGSVSLGDDTSQQTLLTAPQYA